MVQINRFERKAKLEIDGGNDVNKGESPGSMFEMSISDSFFLGGLPPTIKKFFFSIKFFKLIIFSNLLIEPFRGCIKNLKLDADYVNLNKAKASKGVQNSCTNKNVRIISLTSNQSFASFNNLYIDKEIEFSIRFRSEQINAHIATITINNVFFLFN